MLYRLIKGIRDIVSFVWTVGISIPSIVYKWIAVILIVCGVLGIVFYG